MKPVKPPVPDTTAADLRSRAERRLQERRAPEVTSQTDTFKLLHELQVHQIELEMQNEELNAAKMKSDEALARYTDLYDFAPVSYFTVDRTGAIRQLNLEAARILGTQRHKLMGQHLGVYIVDKDLPKLNNAIGRLFKHEQAKEVCDLMLTNKDGSLSYVYLEAQLDENNEFCRVTLVDITERKKILQDLNDNEVKYRTLFESSSDAILLLGYDEGFITCNESARQMFRSTKSKSCLGLQPFDLSPPVQADGKDSRAAAKVHMQDAIRNGKSFYEWTHRRFDDEEFPAEVSLSALSLGDKQLIQVRLRDITEKKRMDEELDRYQHHLEEQVEQRTKALQDAELKYRTVADYTYDWEVWSDEQGNWLYCSPACERITGYQREAFMDDPRLFIDIAHPDDRIQLTAHFSNMHQSSDVHKETFRIHRKDGELRWLEHICQPVFDDKGKTIGQRASNSDVTSRLNAEHLLIQARDDAQSAAKSKSDFLANMSHEIRTPLNAIIGLSHLMARDQLSDRHKEKVTKIQHAGQHLLMLINDILDLSKIGAGKLELEQLPLRVESLQRHVISLLSEQARAKGLDLTVHTDPLPDNLLGDSTRLTQILINLTGNAIKFTEQGSVNLQIHLESDSEDSAVVLFEVTDSGIGVSEKAQQMLFSAFDQADSSITRSHGGTGLGLSVSRQLVEAMGGSIGVDSEPGKGSRFWFSIPFSKGVTDEDQLPKQVSEQELEITLKRDYQSSKLLLVEDDPINQEVAVELLQSVGLQIVTANNGVEAIAKLKQGLDCQLVLMDMQMPVMGGLEATRRIRQIPAFSQLPIIAMTANAFAEDRKACLVAGMNDFASKPVDPSALFATLIRWLPKPEASSKPLEQKSNSHHAGQGENEAEISFALVETLASFPGLDMQLGLRSISNLTMLVKLLKKFQTLNTRTLQELEELQEKGHHEDARRLVHSTKGSAGTLGLVDLQEASAELEQAIKAEAPQQEVAVLMDRYEHELQNVLNLELLKEKDKQP